MYHGKPYDKYDIKKASNNHINKINMFGIRREEYITKEFFLIVVS